MSNKIHNGGPAFPAGSVRKSRPAHDPGGDWVETDRVQPLHQGLSLRDYFAAAALHGLIAYHGDKMHIVDKDGRTGLHLIAYDHADAMLRARDAE